MMFRTAQIRLFPRSIFHLRGQLAPTTRWRTGIAHAEADLGQFPREGKGEENEEISETIKYADDLYYPRLERYFNDTLLEEQLILNYDHSDFYGEEELNKEIQRVKSKSKPEKLIERLYTVDVCRIPTYPGGKVTTALLEDRSYMSIIKRNKDLPKYKRGNFLDPSYLGGGHLKIRNEMPPPKIDYPPKLPRVLQDIPRIEHLFLLMLMKNNAEDPVKLIRAKMLLYLISGVKVGNCTYKEKTERRSPGAKSRIVGARTTITGPEAYSFIDKTINIVMPNMHQWDGLTPFSGPLPGSLSFMIPSRYVVFYPDVYSIRDEFPEFFDLHVIIQTSAPCVNSTATLLSAFQFPFVNNVKYAHLNENSDSLTNPIPLRGNYVYELTTDQCDAIPGKEHKGRAKTAGRKVRKGVKKK